jgi:hypothetical protein
LIIRCCVMLCYVVLCCPILMIALYNEAGDGEGAGGAENNEPGLEEDDEGNGEGAGQAENNEPGLEEDDGKAYSLRPPNALCGCELI